MTEKHDSVHQMYSICGRATYTVNFQLVDPVNYLKIFIRLSNLPTVDYHLVIQFKNKVVGRENKTFQLVHRSYFVHLVVT